ncbi:MAG: ABC transporter ATP-binding protein [Solirubrobacterales bacterium]|nr:ABC transporter ATP-binding protein [Solirubrobacterales bacterium]
MLTVRSLGKRFGSRTALSGISFELDAGELVAIIGPNGAGKTTLLSILAGVLEPSEGEVVGAVHAQPGGSAHAPNHDEPHAARPKANGIGWVPQQPALYSKLSVAENLRLFAHLEKVVDPDKAVDRMLEQTGLGDRADDEVGLLSGGNQQRVNIAIGLLAQPAVLLLDEPSAALDPRQRERLWEFISALGAGGTTVVFSSHNVGEAERYADRVLVLVDGELLFGGSAAELERVVGPSRDFEAAFVSFLHARGH